MVYLHNKAEYKLSHTMPHMRVTLRDSLVAQLRGFVLKINQTITMKKILGFLVAVLVLVPTVSFASFDVSLKYGSRGDDVSELQDFLQDQGNYTGKVDGKFGLGTLKAVKAWQNVNELNVDGYFGRASRVKANEILAQILSASNAMELAETGGVSSPSSFIDGCTSLNGYSITTGRKCDGSTPTPIPVVVVQQPNNPPPALVVVQNPVTIENKLLDLCGIQIHDSFISVDCQGVSSGDKFTLTVQGLDPIVVIADYGTRGKYSGGGIAGRFKDFYFQNLPVDNGEEVGPLQPDTDYTYTLRTERGNQYYEKTRAFRTLKNNS